MPKFVHEQTSFNAGILSPKLLGQTSLSQYTEGLKDSLNMISTKYGPLSKRCGTEFVFPVKDQAKLQRIIPFSFSRDQNLVLEVGDRYIRFMTFDESGVGLVPDPIITTKPYELVTPYTEADLAELDYTQSADVMYLSHPNYPPKELRRYANDNWVLKDLNILDGPYEDMNADATITLTPAAATGNAITITASKALFTAKDVGRYLRLHNQTGGTVAWGYAIITEYTDTTHVKVNIIQPFATTSASMYWRLGSWNSFRGYPKACTIHQQRLIFAGGSEKQTYWGSNISQYDNFAPSDLKGVITDSHGFNYNLATEQFNGINWILSFRSLLTGTTGSEFRLYSSGPVLTPADRVANRESSFGTVDIKPVIIDNYIVFLQRLERKLRLFEYDYTTDSYTGPDLTLLADHLTLGGIKCMAYQKEPYSVLWVVKRDGNLLSLVIDKEQKVFAWNTHDLKGGTVLDVAVIPSDFYKQDVVFFIVKRLINGAYQKYIEIMTPEFTENVSHKDSCFLDCSLRYKGVATTEITGLDHLEGEEVYVMNMGASEPPTTVSDGKITLEFPVTEALVGLGFQAWAETLPPALNLDGKSYRNSKKRITNVVFSIYRTLGVSVKESRPSAVEVIIPDKKDRVIPESIPALRTEDVMQNPPSRSSSDMSLFLTSTPGQPFTLRGLTVEIESSD